MRAAAGAGHWPGKWRPQTCLAARSACQAGHHLAAAIKDYGRFLASHQAYECSLVSALEPFADPG
jgi:hypothetical protein